MAEWEILGCFIHNLSVTKRSDRTLKGVSGAEVTFEVHMTFGTQER